MSDHINETTEEPTYEVVAAHQLKWLVGSRRAAFSGSQRCYAIADVDTGALWSGWTNQPSTWSTRAAAEQNAQYCAELYPNRLEVVR